MPKLRRLTIVSLDPERLAHFYEQVFEMRRVANPKGEAIYLSDRVLVFSERPGRIVEEIVVTLPRAGRRASMLSEEYLRLKRRIMSALAGDGMLAAASGIDAS